jgi:L-ribulose-5-phosphate 4-epimerase
MTRALREQVLEANQELARRDLARFTFGNASAIDRDRGLVGIKPSGVPYESLTARHVVITTMDGKVVEGKLRPSSDLPTHLELYRAFSAIGGIVHTHSHFATVWAQARREIPCLGTTHADYFHGAVPVTDTMEDHEIGSEYEANTGRVIVRRFAGIDPLDLPAVLVSGHASFCWGRTVADAVDVAAILEEVAAMAYRTVTLEAGIEAIPATLLDKHFQRKHGPGAYYGQEVSR